MQHKSSGLWIWAILVAALVVVTLPLYARELAATAVGTALLVLIVLVGIVGPPIGALIEQIHVRRMARLQAPVDPDPAP